MSETIINGIDVSEYFTNHYDNSGKLYAVEYKGNPLELQNAIKRLQEGNKELKKRQITKNGFICDCEQNAKYKQALEEIREIAKHWLNNDWSCYHCRSNMDEKLKEIIKLTRF